MIRTDDIFTGINVGDIENLSELTGSDKEKILFIDIETTGLSPKNSDLYLIGCLFLQNDKWHIAQFFAESSSQEEEILKTFADFCAPYETLIHFNGDRFDLPFLKAKYEKYSLPDPFADKESFDIYKAVKPYKLQLGLPDLKQKTIELYLGIDRKDEYSGGELIAVYRKYTKERDLESKNIILLHNFEDVQGLLKILPILTFDAFFKRFKAMPQVSVRTDGDISSLEAGEELFNRLPLRAVKVQANHYKDYNGEDKKEVFMKFTLPFELASSLSGNDGDFFFKIEKSEGTLRTPLYETELKYFYSNYKDYYYLPHEDMAIHKSLADFVDKNFKEKAKPENCYTKKTGQYLKEWDLVFAPFFKKDYGDEEYFFDLNDNMKKSRYAMSLYGCHVIRHILGI